MSIDIIQQRQHCTEVSYSLFWEYDDMPGGGFSFPCDEKGNLSPDFQTEKPIAWDSYQKCLSGTVSRQNNDGIRVPTKMVGPTIQKYQDSWVEPAIGRCVCGHEVILSGFTNTCARCQRDYNMSGQELANIDQWGEETDESLSDILSIR